MGVYIDMEMPQSCGVCRLCGGIADTDCGPCAWCDVDGKARAADTRQDCPLVPVPPHGRCVDADKLMQEMRLFVKENMLLRDDARELLETIEGAPTIIPAEEGE